MNRYLSALLILAFACSSCNRKPGAAATAPGRNAPAPVDVTKVERLTLPLEIQAIGTVEALQTVDLKSQVGGVLQSIHFKEGDPVKQGQLLFTIDPAPFKAALQQAEANLERSRVEERNAGRQMQRYTELQAKGAASKEQSDQLQSAADAAKAQIRAAQAAVETAKLQFGYSEIRAPISGRIGACLLDEGNIVKANADSPLAVVNQIQPIHVNFSVPERFLNEIRGFDKGKSLKVLVFQPETNKQIAEGTLDFIDNKVDADTGTVLLRGLVPNKDELLWPGQFVQVKLVLAEEGGVIAVAESAVQVGQKGHYAFVVKGDNTAELRTVEVGRTVNGLAVVKSGLAEGETVVAKGQLRVVPGGKVEVRR